MQFRVIRLAVATALALAPTASLAGWFDGH